MGAPARARTLFPSSESARKSSRGPRQSALQLEQRRRALLEIREAEYGADARAPEASSGLSPDGAEGSS
ncbi:unnamed protein product [Rangifer tarandus platyrhynchus]|uniref:Uncharacterized protein n=2 Tax=Rangifer tarandus platyrhynchus TaxID=3082113 RepID=A0ACB0DX68_RANTA|nr:unnamed protein product [Rangifer tarandus platyrhynchus]CAI9692821.1 unnamed protein product [Rangifer tarandus platyrhynchus]